MSSTVPRAAAEWMAFHLRNAREDKNSTANRLETYGLGVLTVKELKHLGDILYSMVAVIEEVSIRERRLPASSKKRRRIDFLRRGLFRDDPCTIVNERLLRDMRVETDTTSSTVGSTVAASSSVDVSVASDSGEPLGIAASGPGQA